MATRTEYLDGADVRMMYPGEGQQEEAKGTPVYNMQHRPSFAHLEVDVSGGRSITANAGAMLWKTGNVQMETDCYGGFKDAWCRASCAGESFCQNRYTGDENGSKVAFGFDLPGDMLAFQVSPSAGWVLSTQSFIAADDAVHVSAKFPGCKVALCGGEGLFLTHIFCDPERPVGYFFAGDYGALQRHVVAPGKKFWINAGLFFACPDSTEINVTIASGFKTCCCGMEGFVMEFTGPATVYTQNRDPAVMRRLLNPPIPSGGSDGNDGGGAGDVGGA